MTDKMLPEDINIAAPMAEEDTRHSGAPEGGAPCPAPEEAHPAPAEPEEPAMQDGGPDLPEEAEEPEWEDEPEDTDELDELEQAELDRLMSKYVFDEETGMVFEISEKRSRPFAPWAAVAFCALVLITALCAGLVNGRGLTPGAREQQGESILAEQQPEQQEEQPNEAPVVQEEQPTADMVEYIPAAILLEEEPIATLASEEAAYALLEEVKAYFDAEVEGEGEKVSAYMEEPVVAPNPGALPEEIQSYDELYALFTSSRSPLRVMTVLTRSAVKAIPYDTEEERDKYLVEGTSIIVSQGREGSETEITRNVYINGDRSSSRSGTEKQKIQPQDRVIRQGSQDYDDEDSPGRREGQRGPDAEEAGLSFTAPIDGDIILNYGQVTGVLHLGLDYGEPEDGAMVLASCGGTVVSAMERGGYGLMLEIDHGGGFTSRYAGLGSLLVALGDAVEQGQPIAVPGGAEDEPALHFEIRVDGEAYNPRYYLD